MKGDILLTSESIENQKKFKITEESDLSLEVVILLILGVFMFLFGSLLFGIHTGTLPYTPDSTYGLFLVIVSFQMITMGKTPFGDLRRSWILIIIGICTAIIGMTAGFIPGYLSELVRLLVGFILFAGGIALILQLFLSSDKAKTWIKVPGILQHLTIACAVVYVLTIIEGLITLLPGITTTPQTAVITIIYGISFFYLSWCIHKVAQLYPSEKTENPEINTLNKEDNTSSKGIFSFFKETSLPLTFAILIMLGVLLTILGILLFPVTNKLIPFSPDGQLGMLLFIFSIQMMALGETFIGPFKRSWLMIIIGLIFAVLGIFSCIVPGILTAVLALLIGSMSIIGGVLLIIQRFLPGKQEIEVSRQSEAENAEIASITKKLVFTQTLINVVAILFGISALMQGLLPGIVVAGLLVVYGLIIFVLVFLLHKMTLIEAKGTLIR